MTLEQFAVFVGSTLRLATPILFGATGEIVSEKAGVLNMSIEGMMLAGAFGGALGSLVTGSASVGFICGILAVLPVALLQAFLSNTLKVNQIVSGIGINILALGTTTLAYREIFGARSEQLVQGFSVWSPPLLADIPVVGRPIFEQVWIVYLAVLILAAVAFILNYTSIGLAIRAVGVDPIAANNAGVPVTLVRYGAVLFVGFLLLTRRSLHLAREHTYIHRGNDEWCGLSCNYRSDLWKLAPLAHDRRLPSIRSGHGASVPASCNGDYRSDCSSHHVAVSARLFSRYRPCGTADTACRINPAVLSGNKVTAEVPINAGALRCFCAGDFKPVLGASNGPLAGLTFAVKDMIDTAGAVTGCGNPDWWRTHAPAAHNAPCVQRLLDAGATLIARTITDELAFSLEGENHFEGTPVNPLRPDRLAGGSSSGSAVAVAGGLADFALGTDTGGSVRVPAAFCGVYGFRPTHGAISTQGVVPFAPSLDTVGWFAKDAVVLAKLGGVLLPRRGAPEISQILIAEDAFALADQEISSILMEAIDGFRLPTKAVNAAPYPIADISQAYRHIQAVNIVDAQGKWLREVNPRFGPNIAPRFESIWASSADDVGRAKQLQSRLQEYVASLFESYPEAALALPSAPCFPPKPGMAAQEASGFYTRALAIGGIASLCGLPQIAIPIHTAASFASLGLAGGPGSDQRLLDFADHLARTKESS